MDETRSPLIQRVRKKATTYHDKIPYLRKLPGSALAIVLFLVLVNLLVWTACAIVLHFHTSLVSTAVLAYTLGLRHALDADHIAAIDLCTRRLVASGQRPVTVGTFFSLGHSTIVVVTSIVVAASSAAISDRFDAFGPPSS
jgi:high-affinity nickel-transport protein